MLALRAEQTLSKLNEIGRSLDVFPKKENWNSWALEFDPKLYIKLEKTQDFASDSWRSKVQLPEIKEISLFDFSSSLNKSRDANAQSKPEKAEIEENDSVRFVRVSLEQLNQVTRALADLQEENRALREFHKSLKRENAVAPKKLLFFEESLDSQDRQLEELAQSFIKIRLVDLKDTFRRFPRMVLSLARSLNKEINFEIEGQETQIDASLVREIVDPLVHLLRNAVDHGIETPEERLRLDKPKLGSISLKAYRLGREVIFEIEDDGIGLSKDQIYQKAKEKGLTALDREKFFEQSNWSKILFQEGFSTRDKAQEVSGRGLGLSVVKEKLLKLQGEIEVEELDPTRPNSGTRFRLKVPLTQARGVCFLVQVQGVKYAIPVAAVQEVVPVAEVSIEEFPDLGKVAHWKNYSVPFFHLQEKLGLEISSTPKILILVAHAGRRYALGVDSIQGRVPLVLQPLTPNFDSVEGISGASLTASSDVILVLDLATLGEST